MLETRKLATPAQQKNPRSNVVQALKSFAPEHPAIIQVQSILERFTTHGSLSNGRSLVRHNDEDITLIDVSKFFISSHDAQERNYLIVCLLNHEATRQLLGLPIPKRPTILEVSDEKFGKLPDLYCQNGIPKAVEKLIHFSKDLEVFYLNLEQLVN